jgi:hypothetical protein
MQNIAGLIGKTAGAAQVALSRIRNTLLECIQKFIAERDVQ